MSKYQKKIIESLKHGARLQCTEGCNYKTWLKHLDGEVEIVRKDSVWKVCVDYENKLVFGEEQGIRWRNSK